MLKWLMVSRQLALNASLCDEWTWDVKHYCLSDVCELMK